MPPVKRTESSIERSIVEQAWKRYRVKMPKMGKDGWPDRLVLLGRGRCAFMEMKALGKKATPRQKAIHDMLWHLGYWVEVVDDVEVGLAVIAEWRSR